MTTTWGIHNDQPTIDPIQDGAVRIGWEIGDLSGIAPTREAFKVEVGQRMPELEEAKIPSSAGTLYRFVHEIRDGDVVVCPNRRQSTLDIGVVTGPYQFHAESALYKHWRPVSWVRTGVPRTELSKAAQHELGSATTLFKISTAEAEVLHLMSSPARNDKPDYTWTTFYPQLVDALLSYVDDRTILLEKVWNLARASGRPELFKYLQSDRYVDGTSGPLRDVDPFTVLSSFNRGILEDARADIARAFGTEFGVAPPYPVHFPGIPIVNNMASWFVRYENERGERIIPALWELCGAGAAYAADATEETRERLVGAFDACAIGNTVKLTMGLFWARPKSFAAYDVRNVTFLKEEFPALAATLSLGSRIDGEQFLANTEAMNVWLADPESPYNTFAEFSNAAWQYGLAPTPDTSPVPPSTPISPATKVAPGESYTTDSIREDGGFVSAIELEAMLERLRAKKNVILQGPPGTGKTWLARRLGWALCDERGSDRVQVVQFHPSLTYEDFVRGWRPTGSALELTDGPFLTICTEAAAHPEDPYVLVIEEVNRGNPAQILGELLTLIEADYRSPEYAIRLAYPRNGERFFVPPNVHLLGTMNVADRSLAIVDMALRRRFSFIELKPAFDEDWVQHVSGLGYDLKLLEVYGKRLNALNETIANDGSLGRQYCVGHSFFTPHLSIGETGLDTPQWWQRVIETDIRPLLEEYWFDQPDTARAAIAQLLGP
ncbi:AAA family ATPase [Agromyces sp. NPDC057865]|uniref:AAA family ATPase n=1 Tax=Agromyces sp. NPDC057865 TaxID=3346267 RepID=UPI00366CAA1B